MSSEVRAITVTIEPNIVRASVDSDGKAREIGNCPIDESGRIAFDAAMQAQFSDATGDAAPVNIVIDNANVIRRQFTLPKAAGAEISGALSFELERQTPFRADEIYLAYDVTEDAGDDQLQILAAIVPRKLVDPIVSALQETGLNPRSVRLSPLGAGGASGQRLPVPGLTAIPSKAPGYIRYLALLACVLSAAAVGLLFYKLGQINRDLEQSIAAAAQQAGPALDLKNTQNQVAQAYTRVVQRKTDTPSHLFILAELTKTLPDDVWLVQVDIRGTEITMEGRTNASSANLISLLEENVLFETAKFQAPVTRDATQSYERFNIELKLAGGVETKAPVQ